MIRCMHDVTLIPYCRFAFNAGSTESISGKIDRVNYCYNISTAKAAVCLLAIQLNMQSLATPCTCAAGVIKK